MRLDQLKRKVSNFYKLANSLDNNMADAEKLPANTKDTDTLLKNLSSLNTFKARIEYAEGNLERLSSGSSRVVFETNDGFILKLAKNEKGIAQNGVEGNPKIKSKHVNGAIKTDQDDKWILADKAEKINEEEFKDLTGLDFEDFEESIRFALKKISGSDKEKPKCFEKVKSNDFFQDIYETGLEFDLIPGDLAKISSFKKIKDRVVLVDAGLTREIFEEFYESDSET